jgi:hypothetical protein
MKIEKLKKNNLSFRRIKYFIKKDFSDFIYLMKIFFLFYLSYLIANINQ